MNKRVLVAAGSAAALLLVAAVAVARNPHCAGGIQYVVQGLKDKERGNTEDYMRQMNKAVDQLTMCATEDPEDLERAIELCEYGRKLGTNLQMESEPPFVDFYGDSRIYLRALAGHGVDGAVRYFRSQAERAPVDDTGRHFPGDALVYLLHRCGRGEEAIDAWIQYISPLKTPASVPAS